MAPKVEQTMRANDRTIETFSTRPRAEDVAPAGGHATR